MNVQAVMKKLGISRQSVYNYYYSGKLSAKRTPNGRLDFDASSVILLKEGDDSTRKNVIYARVPSNFFQAQLDEQVFKAIEWAENGNICIDEVFTDLAPNLIFDNRIAFNKMLAKILEGEIARIIVYDLTRIMRHSIEAIMPFFNYFGVEILPIFDAPQPEIDSAEFYEDARIFHKNYALK